MWLFLWLVQQVHMLFSDLPTYPLLQVLSMIKYVYEQVISYAHDNKDLKKKVLNKYNQHHIIKLLIVMRTHVNWGLINKFLSFMIYLCAIWNYL